MPIKPIRFAGGPKEWDNTTHLLHWPDGATPPLGAERTDKRCTDDTTVGIAIYELTDETTEWAEPKKSRSNEGYITKYKKHPNVPVMRYIGTILRDRATMQALTDSPEEL